jgi:hypothetical protein
MSDVDDFHERSWLTTPNGDKITINILEIISNSKKALEEGRHLDVLMALETLEALIKTNRHTKFGI